MNPRESDLADCLLEDALDEVFHGGPDVALADRIIQLARGGAEADADTNSPVDATEAGQPHVVPSIAPALRPLHTTAKPRRWWRYAAEAAVAACVIALVAVLIVPRKPIEPPGVIAFSGAEYEYTHQAEIPEVAVQSGWYVLQDGAPELRAGSNRVQDVKGQVIVKVGEVPNQAELAAMGPWLSEHQIEVEEIEMLNGTWIKAGTLAVFLVTGSAFVDGNFLQAQDREVRKKEAERREAEKKAEGKAEGEKREVERKKEPERPAAELERLRDELAELEKRAIEARELENEKERKARLERIEKAMKEKRERIAELEGKVAEREKVRDGEREKEPKVERRKEAEGDNAEKRREADRRRKAEEEERRKADEEAKEAEARKRREKELEEAERRREGDKREAERKREPERRERKQ